MAQFILNTLEKTRELGKELARFAPFLVPYFLEGPLGSGKTALVRAIVENLPKHQSAEISSPSYTIYNIYPTEPPVLHGDLYRCQNDYPAELEEFAEKGLLLIEWGEFFTPKPADYLDIVFELDHNTRLVKINGFGDGRAIENGLVKFEGGMS